MFNFNMKYIFRLYSNTNFVFNKNISPLDVTHIKIEIKIRNGLRIFINIKLPF